jgi:hypothetical protein
LRSSVDSWTPVSIVMTRLHRTRISEPPREESSSRPVVGSAWLWCWAWAWRWVDAALLMSRRSQPLPGVLIRWLGWRVLPRPRSGDQRCGGSWYVAADSAGRKDALLRQADTTQQAFAATTQKLTQLGPPAITAGKQAQDSAVGFHHCGQRGRRPACERGCVGPKRPKFRAEKVRPARWSGSRLSGTGSDEQQRAGARIW